jgi:hypothetical protein
MTGAIRFPGPFPVVCAERRSQGATHVGLSHGTKRQRLARISSTGWTLAKKPLSAARKAV